MDICDHCKCSGSDESGHCCWRVAMEIKKFKKFVFHSYILEALFDMVISMASVVIDVITVCHYLTKKKWAFAILTGLPVLLPTLVFTNVYLTDESRGYCKMPKERLRRQRELKKAKTRENGDFLNRIEERTQLSRIGPYNCIACFSGLLHSLFHKDRRIRQRGAKLARKSMRRSAKYFFGTLVLRFIAWAWYLKAFIFGVKALRQPKKFMKIEKPDAHWSRELLVRLDFLQASLENSPQCVIQLFALLTQPEEDRVLALLALTFSFIDFIRVAITVLWNINKGPVVAPANCYGSLIRQLMNVCSWVFLYVARCCAISLIIGTAVTAQGAMIVVPVLALFLHCGIFAFLVRKLKLGVASRKVAVTTFISIFFLPDLDSRDVAVMIQFYYGMTLLENIFFIVPWGWDLEFTGFCDAIHKIFETTTMKSVPEDIKLMARNATMESRCLIDPVLIVLLVPCLTVIGIVLRLWACEHMNKFVSGQPQQNMEDETSFTMEARVANIYSRQWTKMSPKEMWNAFMKMLKKEVAPKSSHMTPSLPLKVNNIEGQLVEKPLCKSSSLIWTTWKDFQDVEADADDAIRFIDVALSGHDTSGRILNGFKSVGHNSLQRENILNLNMDVRFLKIETEKGVHIFETIHI